MLDHFMFIHNNHKFSSYLSDSLLTCLATCTQQPTVPKGNTHHNFVYEFTNSSFMHCDCECCAVLLCCTVSELASINFFAAIVSTLQVSIVSVLATMRAKCLSWARNFSRRFINKVWFKFYLLFLIVFFFVAFN